MECQHCERSFSEISEYEAHTSWHTARQADLQRSRLRRHSAYKRPRLTSSTSSPSPRSENSTPNPPESSTSFDSPTSSRKSQPDKPPVTPTEASISAFNFDFGAISPLRPAHNQALPSIRTLDDVVARFPAFEIERTHDQSHISRDFKCADCDAVFSAQKHCDLHNQSKFCPGSAAVAFALYRDPRHPGGYRIDKKDLPFNAYQSTIKCPKCHLTFSDRLLNRVHERSHVDAHLKCLHCQKSCHTSSELDLHYEWHDDMEYRHRRDKCRRRLPGLKLQSEDSQPRRARAGVADLDRRSVFLAEEELTAMANGPAPRSKDQEHIFDEEEELVAISFISPEDLERIHAPNGIFREVRPENLNPQVDSGLHSVANALDALEGRSSDSQASLSASAFSADKEDSPGHSEPVSPRPKMTQKRSSIRAFFRKANPEPQLDPVQKKKAPIKRPNTRESMSDKALAFNGRFLLNAVLQRVSTAANKGDLKTIRKECDQLMAIRPPADPSPEGTLVPVHAFAFPEGTLIYDVAGNQRYVSSEILQEITSGLRRLPVATLAKTKVSVLSTRAYLSTQEANFDDAFWCYRTVMELLRQQPMLFPDVIWQAAIFSSLAHLAARLDRPDEEERYYLKGLAISYNRYGRKDLNNTNFLRALAAAYEKKDQIGKAAEMYKRSLYARMDILGPGDRDTLMAMQDLAAIYSRLGSLTAARLLYEQCLGGFEVQLSLSHKLTLLIVDRLCDIYIREQWYEEALALYRRAFPYLNDNFAPEEELPRNWISNYIQHTPDLDFPPEMSKLLSRYRAVPTEENLWVLQSLAQNYMLLGLVSDASKTFDLVYNARLRLQGVQSPENLDALHGYCFALECMDRLDAAHNAYAKLIQVALRAPNRDDGRSRVMKLNNRLTALQGRKKVLVGEKEAWGLGPTSTGSCLTCRFQTTLLCSRCHVTRFCGEACRELSARSHDQACLPSVSLCQSKSVTAVAGVPPRVEQEALDRLSRQSMWSSGKTTLRRVTDTFTLEYDPRNLTTFRVKINSAMDTFISFDRDADIRFAIMDAADQPSSFGRSGRNTWDRNNGGSNSLTVNNQTITINPASLSSINLSRRNSMRKPTLATVREDQPRIDHGSPINPSFSNQDQIYSESLSSTSIINKTNTPFRWTTPRETESLFFTKDTTTEDIAAGAEGGNSGSPREGIFYLAVAPGAKMFESMLDRRRKLRRADSAVLEGTTLVPMITNVPSQAMIEYAQGLILEGVERKRFAYLVEVAS